MEGRTCWPPLRRLNFSFHPAAIVAMRSSRARAGPAPPCSSSSSSSSSDRMFELSDRTPVVKSAVAVSGGGARGANCSCPSGASGRAARATGDGDGRRRVPPGAEGDEMVAVWQMGPRSSSARTVRSEQGDDGASAAASYGAASAPAAGAGDDEMYPLSDETSQPALLELRRPGRRAEIDRAGGDETMSSSSAWFGERRPAESGANAVSETLSSSSDAMASAWGASVTADDRTSSSAVSPANAPPPPPPPSSATSDRGSSDAALPTGRARALDPARPLPKKRLAPVHTGPGSSSTCDSCTTRPLLPSSSSARSLGRAVALSPLGPATPSSERRARPDDDGPAAAAPGGANAYWWSAGRAASGGRPLDGCGAETERLSDEVEADDDGGGGLAGLGAGS